MNGISIKQFGNMVASVIFALAATSVHAQPKQLDYPAKPIRILVGLSPGGGIDIITRAATYRLSEQLGQPVVIDNRPGSGSLIAMDLAAQSAPDGYTLFSGTDTVQLLGATKRLSYDIRKAFDPVVRMSSQWFLLVINPSLPFRSVKDLIAHAKARPDALSYGSSGIGTTAHLGTERFRTMAGINIVHVPFKGSGPALIALIAGQIQMEFTSSVSGMPHVRSGKLRALAVTGPILSLPDVPTVSESGLPGFKLATTYSLFAPAGTPRAILQKLNRLINEAMRTPEMTQRLAADGASAGELQTPEQFKAEFAKEYADVEKEVRGLNLQLF